MLKKRLGIEGIERDWPDDYCEYDELKNYFKVPSTLVIPEGCEKIGDYAFEGCEELGKVVIPGSVNYVGGYAFAGCENAEITVKESESVEVIRYIASSAFRGCRSVVYVEKEIRY